MFAKQWRNSQPRIQLPARVFYLTSKSTAFEEYYDNIQGHLQLLSGMDELLTGKSEEVLNFCKILWTLTYLSCSGMLSKSRGQVLHLAAVLHMLFTLGTNQLTDDIVSEAAVKAAINYVQVVCQQAA